MASTSDIDNEIIHEVRHDTINKYRAFIESIGEDVDLQNRKLEIDKWFFKGLESLSFLDENGRASENENPLIQEHTDYFELLQTCGNTQLNKMMLVFASLVEELNSLANSAKKFVNPIQLYREEVENVEPKKQNEFTSIVQLLPILFDLICFLKRCYQITSNLILQQHALLSYANAKKQDSVFESKLKEILPVLHQNLRFDLAWTALGNLCTSIVMLDHVFSSQVTTLRRDLYSYKRSLEMILKNPPQFELENRVSEIQAILAIIEEVEHELIEGKIVGPVPSGQSGSGGQDIDFLFFKGIVFSVLNTNFSENGALARNETLNENIALFITQSCVDIERKHCEFIEDRKLLSLCFVYSMYVYLFWKDSDRRLCRMLMDYQRKLNISFVHLPGNVHLSPDQALIHTLPKGIIDKKTIDQFVTARELLMKPGELDSAVTKASLEICHWLAGIEQSFDSGFYTDSSDGNVIKLVFEHIQQLKEGFELIRHLSSLIQSSIAVHYQSNKAISKADSVALCKAVNLLKGIQRFFVRHKRTIIEIVQHFQKYNACAVLKILTRNKRKLMSSSVENCYSEQKLDLLSAIILASNCLNGPVLTLKRFTLISLSLSYLAPFSSLFSQEDTLKIKILVHQLQFFVNIFGTIRRLFGCEFLFFNRAIVEVYFEHFYKSQGAPNNPSKGDELQYFLSALDDAIPMLEDSGKDEPQSKLLIEKFVNDTFGLLKEKILAPLCKDFEDELRLRTHAHLHLDNKSPFVRNLKDYESLLTAEPFKLGRKRIVHFRTFVENHFNKLAYNMTAIALHDWKTYESILGYAHEKYGLNFVSLQLPTQTLEQGLDVLEITRNLAIFVAAYQYNLNNQFFVEKVSNNKHLNVLTIRHVSNSIQTHGFGIINSTVNFAYQFLKNKFQTLSRFLYEEHIKSRLIKDIRHFRELIQKQESDHNTTERSTKFPYEKAEKFLKGIRRLGVGEDGSTYLDKFRVLLTQIGNVLGFVRMLRSGALHCNAEIADYVPDLEDLGESSFEELVKGEGLDFSEQTIEAAKNFDSALDSIKTNYSEATDYFKLLVEVFAKTMRDSKNVHLKNFFVILPATTLNYVEHLLVSKAKLARKNKIEDGATFTDDGFTLGVTYVLKVLEQFADFDTLQWFTSVGDHIRDQAKRGETVASSASATKDATTQTTSLTLKRLEQLNREFLLLKYNMTSCRILFKTSG